MAEGQKWSTSEESDYLQAYFPSLNRWTGIYPEEMLVDYCLEEESSSSSPSSVQVS